MKTYEISIVSEAMVTVKVRARNAEEANDKALERVENILNRLSAKRKYLIFGDMTEHIPAMDDDAQSAATVEP